MALYTPIGCFKSPAWQGQATLSGASVSVASCSTTCLKLGKQNAILAMEGGSSFFCQCSDNISFAVQAQTEICNARCPDSNACGNSQSSLYFSAYRLTPTTSAGTWSGTYCSNSYCNVNGQIYNQGQNGVNCKNGFCQYNNNNYPNYQTPVCNGNSCTIQGKIYYNGENGVQCYSGSVCTYNGQMYGNTVTGGAGTWCNQNTCTVNGNIYKHGDNGVRCNPGYCNHGTITYPNIEGPACDGYSRCVDNGVIYYNGQGGMKCANGNCNYNGQSYGSSVQWGFGAYCNSNTCTVNGQVYNTGTNGVQCTSSSCSYNGIQYPNTQGIACDAFRCTVNGQIYNSGTNGVQCYSSYCSYNGQQYPITAQSTYGTYCTGQYCSVNNQIYRDGQSGVNCSDGICSINGVSYPSIGSTTCTETGCIIDGAMVPSGSLGVLCGSLVRSNGAAVAVAAAVLAVVA
ncbi:hypothetical protein HDU77_007288 [Chytriomyces hyalinus]|nr:hypothetical protein HDU77_007288 [Chytriomyces hyalinus]